MSTRPGLFGLALERVLARREMSNAELARICEVAPSTIGDFIKGEIPVTKKNLTKVLRGITHREDQVELLLAHLQDEVPPDLREEISIHRRTLGDALAVEEAAPFAAPAAAAQILAQLPPRLQDELHFLLGRLATDAQLRDLLSRTIHYMEGEDDRAEARRRQRIGQPATSPDQSAELRRIIEEEDARRAAENRARNRA